MVLERFIILVLLGFSVGVFGQDDKLYHEKIQNAGKLMQNRAAADGANMVNLVKLLSQIDQNTVLKKTLEALLQNGNSNQNSTNAAGILSSLPQVIGLLSKLPNSDEILSSLLKSGISPSLLANSTKLLSSILKIVPQLSSSGNISNVIKNIAGAGMLPNSADGILSTILKAANLPPQLLAPAKQFLSLLEAGKVNDAMSMLSGISKLLNPSSGGSSSAFNINGVSDKCKLHGQLAINAILHGELWALKMIDAAGKIPSDVLSGNLKWIGSYDECRGITANVKNPVTNENTSPFVGQWCAIGVPVGDIIGKVIGNVGALQSLYAYLGIGMCIPDSCNKTELLSVVNQVLPKLKLPGNKTLYAVYANCQINDLEYDTKAIAAIVICSIFIALMALGTAYDIIFIQWNKDKKPESSQNGSLPNGHSLNNGNIQNGIQNGVIQNGGFPKGDLQNGGLQNGSIQNGGFQNGAFEHDINDFKHKPAIDDNFQKQTPTVIATAPKAKSQPGIPARLLLSFSIYTNGKKLLDASHSKGSITSIHGLRFLSMTWVILGHTYAFILSNTANMGTFASKIMNRWTFTAISNALISVDTFFTLSGLLMSYLILKEMKKKNGAGGINWGLFYFHRFWRLTPPYMMILFVYVTTFPYWSDGPFWPQQGIEKDYCSGTWWTNLLYLNNIVKTDEMCFGHAWYLANDMQFYVLSPLLFIPLFYNVAIGLAVCGVFLLTTTITAGVVSSVNDLQPSSVGGGVQGVHHGDYMQEYYFKPWCRMGPYIVGIIGGYIMYKTELKIKIPKVVNFCVWIVAAGVSCAILYGLYGPFKGDNPLSNDVSALYNATHRTVWGVVVSWVVIACASGNGGYVNTLLSWKGFIPVSRLTYCAYLIHPPIMYLYNSSIRQPVYLTDWKMIYLFLGHLMVAYGVAFVLSLAFESPMMGLEKVIFGGRASKQQKETPAVEDPKLSVNLGVTHLTEFQTAKM